MAVRHEPLPAERLAAAHRAVDENRLGLVFQPIFDPATGAVFGYEALARTVDPVFAGIEDLYLAAAQAGRVGELGRIHRTMAIKSAPPLPLFLNVNPYEFEYGWLVRPDDPLFRHPKQLVLEITESAPLSHFQLCRDVLLELRKKGIELAIDDLGAGYSNLRSIADLAPDFVKLDRSLVARLHDGSRQFRLVESLVGLCHGMGARVIAEGIETSEELVTAERAGADYFQGYLLGAPDLPPRSDAWPALRRAVERTPR